MRIKIILLVLAILSIITISLFAIGLKEASLKGIVEKVPEYNCGKGNLCTSCIVEGSTCSCGGYTCNCGNKSVNKTECDLL